MRPLVDMVADLRVLAVGSEGAAKLVTDSSTITVVSLTAGLWRVKAHKVDGYIRPGRQPATASTDTFERLDHTLRGELFLADDSLNEFSVKPGVGGEIRLVPVSRR